MTRPGRGWLLPLAALALIILLALTAGAALGTDRLGGKVRFGDTITVPSSETVDHDLYLFAGQINVNGNVKGDLVVVRDPETPERFLVKRVSDLPDATQIRVAGDNADRSRDSRSFGPIPLREIVGKVWIWLR